MSKLLAPPHAERDSALAAEFDVLCLDKYRPAVDAAQLPSHGVAPLTYEDVIKELDSERWSFEPYPRCDRSQLLQVHTYWLAVPRQGLRERCHAEPVVEPQGGGSATSSIGEMGGTSEAKGGEKGSVVEKQEEAQRELPSPIPAQQHDSVHPSCEAPVFSCVVGVVWVRLSPTTGRSPTHSRAGAVPPRGTSAVACAAATSAMRSPGPAVEGYLQVVLTHPSYRRRGLGSWLLRRCLAQPEAPANVFASDRNHSSNSPQPYRIQRWHLHTLKSLPVSDRLSKSRRQDSGEGGNVADSAAAAVVEATLAMYSRLGFAERRYLYGYYGGVKDAVELVKDC